MVGQNGNDGNHYLVELVARRMAGDMADQPLMGKFKGKKGWQLFIDVAIDVIKIVEEHNASND